LGCEGIFASYIEAASAASAYSALTLLVGRQRASGL